MKNLQADVFGGTTFHEDNDIQARIKTKQITIHNKFTVLQTNSALPLPNAPNHSFCKLNAATTLFPDSYINIPTGGRLPDSPTIAVFPDPPHPEIHPTICNTPSPGEDIVYHNTGNRHISLPAKMTFKCLAIKPEQNNPLPTVSATPYSQPKLPPLPISGDSLNINSAILSDDQRNAIIATCQEYSAAFNPDLSGGYNHNAGKYFASLRFKSDSRPQAKALGMPNYSKKCASMQQALMDRLEEQGVLVHPQDHDIQVRLISPSWVLQKGSAKNTPLQDCTLDQLRFVVAFNALNEHLLPQPAKPSSAIKAMKFLARWKYHIFADLQNSYFQIHMAKKDWCWLGVMTPFKGARVFTRAGQGLLNSEAALDDLLERVLGDHIAAGICEIARDDIQIGGDTIDQAIQHWRTVLSALAKANLKLTAKKVRFFPQETEVYGWKYSLDGSIAPSDHIITDLGVTDITTLKTVKSVNSWRGLYKTLLPALPNLAALMDPFDKASAQLQTRGVKEFEWTPHLTAAFNLAQSHLKTATKRTLPKPHEQLLLQPDGAQTPPCIGWCLYVLRNVNGQTTPIPVQFASAKLSPYMMHWKPCEIEAVAAATAIDQCSHWIMEADKPTLVCPDSKAVVQATERMRRGQMSKNPRLQTILSCINRRPVTFHHSSAKLGQHLLSDLCSRTDKTCKTQDCAIERFLDDIPSKIQLMSAVIEPTNITDLVFQTNEPCVIAATATTIADWLGGTGNIPIGSHDTWRQLQRQDPDTNAVIHMFTTGDSPRKATANTPVNRFYKNAELQDGLLIVRAYDGKLLRTINRIVIPPTFLSTVLTTIHNRANHPTKHQMQQLINRYFFASGLDHKIDELLQQCILCTSLKRFPATADRSTDHIPTSSPGTSMNMDIIKRAGQLIMVTMDLHTNYTTTALIQSEKRDDLLQGIITTTTPIRLSAKITVRTDRAPALQSLASGHPDLSSIGITVEMPKDAFNKNANCHIDKCIQELELEIKKISPLGKPISHSELAAATIALNNKIRRTGLTAAEQMFSRDAATNDRIPATAPQKTKPGQTPENNTSTGDIVFIKSHGSKHTVRQPFVVTSSNGQHVTVRKILNHSDPAKPQRLSHIQQATSTVSTFPAPIPPTPWYQHPTPNSHTPHRPPPKPPDDSDSDYYDDDDHLPNPVHHHHRQNNPPPVPPPPPPPPLPPNPLLLPAPLLNQFNLAAAIREIALRQPPEGPLPHLRAIHDYHRDLARRLLPHPDHPPPPPDLPPRAAKLSAQRKLCQNIPQLEGAEITPASSTNPTPSPTTSPLQSFHNTTPSSPSHPSHPLSPLVPWSPTNSSVPDSLEWDASPDTFHLSDWEPSPPISLPASPLSSTKSQNFLTPSPPFRLFPEPHPATPHQPLPRRRRHTFNHFCESRSCRCAVILPDPSIWSTK